MDGGGGGGELATGLLGGADAVGRGAARTGAGFGLTAGAAVTSMSAEAETLGGSAGAAMA
jgi:hypothetical protein